MGDRDPHARAELLLVGSHAALEDLARSGLTTNLAGKAGAPR